MEAKTRVDRGDEHRLNMWIADWLFVHECPMSMAAVLKGKTPDGRVGWRFALILAMSRGWTERLVNGTTRLRSTGGIEPYDKPIAHSTIARVFDYKEHSSVTLALKAAKAAEKRKSRESAPSGQGVV